MTNLTNYINNTAKVGGKFTIYGKGESKQGSGVWTEISANKISADAEINILGKDFKGVVAVEIVSNDRVKVTAKEVKIGESESEGNIEINGKELKVTGMNIHTIRELSITNWKDDETRVSIPLLIWMV